MKEHKVKFIAIFFTILMCGCAAKTPVSDSGAAATVSADNVSVILNNQGAKNQEVVARYPDQQAVKAVFVEEINRTLADLQASKGALAQDGRRLVVEVTYERRFALVPGAVTLPNGSFSVAAFDPAGEELWRDGKQDIYVSGNVYLNILDIYKVPVGLFRQDEERKYLRIWAREIGKMIYKHDRQHVGESASNAADTPPVSS